MGAPILHGIFDIYASAIAPQWRGSMKCLEAPTGPSLPANYIQQPRVHRNVFPKK